MWLNSVRIRRKIKYKLSYLFTTGKVWGMPFRKMMQSYDYCGKVIVHEDHGTIAGLHEKWFGLAPPDSAGDAVRFWSADFDGHLDNGHKPSC